MCVHLSLTSLSFPLSLPVCFTKMNLGICFLLLLFLVVFVFVFCLCLLFGVCLVALHVIQCLLF